MTDVLIYWRDYKKNREESDGEFRWHSSARVFGNLHPGDRLWMVTSGKHLGTGDAPQAGFLVGVWRVQRVAANPGDDERYPKGDYRYRVRADPSASLLLEEPVLVDHVVRPPGRDRARAIGSFLQGPRKLKDEKVRLLKAAAGPVMAKQYLNGDSKTKKAEDHE